MALFLASWEHLENLSKDQIHCQDLMRSDGENAEIKSEFFTHPFCLAKEGIELSESVTV